MNLRQHLDSLPHGGISSLAIALGISSVYLHQLAAKQDGRQPSPELCVQIERLTEGAVARQDLRPDDWHLIWPELANPKAMGVTYQAVDNWPEELPPRIAERVLGVAVMARHPKLVASLIKPKSEQGD